MNKYGVIYPGKWDLFVKELKDYSILEAFRQRFLYNHEWSSTKFYKRICNEINSGIEKFGVKNVEEYGAYLDKIENLFIIKNEGVHCKIKCNS